MQQMCDIIKIILEVIFLKMKTINDLTNLANGCKRVTKIRYKKGDIISNLIPNKNHFGLIVEGCADLIRYDLSGNRSIVERYYKGDIFGELLLLPHNVNELFVEAKTSVTVIFFSHDYIVNKCNDLLQQLKKSPGRKPSGRHRDGHLIGIC